MVNKIIVEETERVLATKLEMDFRGYRCFSVSGFSELLAPAGGTSTAERGGRAAADQHGHTIPAAKRIEDFFFGEGERGTTLSQVDESTFAVLFRIIELILQDFREKLTSGSEILVLIQTVGAFARCVHLSVNVSFTAIKHLWGAADILGRLQAQEQATQALKQTEKRMLPVAPPPAAGTADTSSCSSSAAGSGSEQDVALPHSRSPEDDSRSCGDWVWVQLFRQLQISCLDPRQEVRDCALKSLIGALCAGSSTVAAPLGTTGQTAPSCTQHRVMRKQCVMAAG